MNYATHNLSAVILLFISLSIVTMQAMQTPLHPQSHSAAGTPGAKRGFRLRSNSSPDRLGQIRAPERPKDKKSKLANPTICSKCLPPDYGINTQNHLGLTPLHRACMLEHTKCAELLVAAGANANIPDQYGGTPLHYAYFANNSDLILLLDNGTYIANKKHVHPETARVIRNYLDKIID